MNWHCKRCDSNFDSVMYNPSGREFCPNCGEHQLIKLQWKPHKKEKENDMKKVYEYVVYDQEELLWSGSILAADENQARLLISDDIDPEAEIDFSAEGVEVRIRPFC